MRNKDSLYICLLNKELQRLYQLVTANSDTSSYSNRPDVLVRNWAMDQITQFHKSMTGGTIFDPAKTGADYTEER